MICTDVRGDYCCKAIACLGVGYRACLRHITSMPCRRSTVCHEAAALEGREVHLTSVETVLVLKKASSAGREENPRFYTLFAIPLLPLLPPFTSVRSILTTFVLPCSLPAVSQPQSFPFRSNGYVYRSRRENQPVNHLTSVL